MGSRRLTGPLTDYIAAALSARREALGMTYDALSAASGVSKPTVHGGLKGTQSIAVEAYVTICCALGVDAGRLLDDAERATRDALPLSGADDMTMAAWDKRREPDHEAGGL